MRHCPNRDFALILAAGFSTRMGICKTSLPWHDNRTLLRYQAEQFLQTGITPIIVLGSHNAQRQVDCPDGSRVVINECSQNGKTSSILTGLQLLPQHFSSVIISAVDQPRSLCIYQSLLQTYRQKQALIVAPCHRGKLGHPLLFSDRLLPELKNITEASLGLRRVVNKFYNAIAKVEFSTSEVISDLNTRDRYQLELSKYQVAKS
ncbi:NTP transferase domain-containing protein [Myxosarcina sp. GI1]|uniref:nucleotidyltransferase family protein n=1 Tax=Myxosarcina sp. GI1 TaxID=1541065 RepID=UPI000565DB1B|nr:nucleotidyltransferase family protein [Myxosarcina sp. GI1]